MQALAEKIPLQQHAPVALKDDRESAVMVDIGGDVDIPGLPLLHIPEAAVRLRVAATVHPEAALRQRLHKVLQISYKLM